MRKKRNRIPILTFIEYESIVWLFVGIPIHYWTYSPSTTKQPPYLINSNQYPKYNKKENNLVVVWLVLIDLSYAPGWINFFFFCFLFLANHFSSFEKKMFMFLFGWLIFVSHFFLHHLRFFFRIEIGCVCVWYISRGRSSMCMGFLHFPNPKCLHGPHAFLVLKKKKFSKRGDKEWL